MANFDRQLSLAIDIAHDTIDRLAGQRGLWALLRRSWVRFQLRQLEKRVP